MPTCSLRPFSTARRPMRRCARRILEAAEGNPLFVEEMVALVRASPTAGGRRAADDPGIAGRTARPARPARTGRARARLGRGPRLSSRRGAGALARRSRASRAAHGARAKGAAAPRPAAVTGRGCLSLPPPADSRRRIRRRSRKRPGPSCTSASPAGSSSAVPTSSSWTRSSAITSSGRTRYLIELGPANDASLRVSRSAGERLATAGTKAAMRGDIRAATSLLARAVALLPTNDARRLSVLPMFGRALLDAGQWDRAKAVLLEATEAARAAGDAGPRGRRGGRADKPPALHGRDDES